MWSGGWFAPAVGVCYTVSCGGVRACLLLMLLVSLVRVVIFPPIKYFYPPRKNSWCRNLFFPRKEDRKRQGRVKSNLIITIYYCCYRSYDYTATTTIITIIIIIIRVERFFVITMEIFVWWVYTAGKETEPIKVVFYYVRPPMKFNFASERQIKSPCRVRMMLRNSWV